MDAWQLLQYYNNETSCFFATPKQSFLAQGIREVLPTTNAGESDRDLPSEAMSFLEKHSQSGYPPAPLIGALPYDSSATAHLFVPEQIYRAGPLKKTDAAGKPEITNPNQCQLKTIPEPSIYMQGVEQGLEHIHRAELFKIVLSRSLELSFPQKLDMGKLLGNLARGNRYGYTYLIDLPSNLASSHWLIGASPELLVRRQGMQVETNPLAGSAPLSGDSITDRQRAEALMNSDKDRREHAMVVEAIADTLNPLCSKLDVPPAPCIIHTDSMMHLSTRIQGTLRDSDTCALSVALALHPTPAVCGTPPQSACSAIHAIEPFDRRYFSGMVGWVDARGDGEWAVTIRCGEAEGSRLRLYAGAGVVAGSTAEKELAETSAKFRTMLKALGLDRLLEVTA
jgi:isochorismate synthase